MRQRIANPANSPLGFIGTIDTGSLMQKSVFSGKSGIRLKFDRFPAFCCSRNGVLLQLKSVRSRRPDACQPGSVHATIGPIWPDSAQFGNQFGNSTLARTPS
jgi:hypothetical protein